MKLAELLPTISKYQQRHQNVVLVTGVFDVLHPHHYQFLVQAKAAGDILLVGLETDQRVAVIKGVNRPIYPQDERVSHLNQLGVADHVFVLPSQFSTPQDHRQLIAQLKPQVLAVSAHTKHIVAKQAILAEYGGCVEVVYEHHPGMSTSQLLSLLEVVPYKQKTHLKFIQPPRYKVQTISGHARGRLMGFPTLNLVPGENFDCPLGIFGGQVYINKKSYLGAFHWGPIPSYDQAGLSLEVFVLDTQLEKTPQEIEFTLNYKIRDIIKFTDMDKLKQQIKQDVEVTRDLITLAK